VETFDAQRLLRVHPGPVAVALGSAVVVLRSLERYPRGAVVLWTCSPSQGATARLAQGTPRVTLALGDDAGTTYAPLGEATSGGGRTLFGASFFGTPVPEGVDAVQVRVAVSGTAGGEIGVEATATFSL
jgi:hypothetical protein